MSNWSSRTPKIYTTGHYITSERCFKAPPKISQLLVMSTQILKCPYHVSFPRYQYAWKRIDIKNFVSWPNSGLKMVTTIIRRPFRVSHHFRFHDCEIFSYPGNLDSKYGWWNFPSTDLVSLSNGKLSPSNLSYEKGSNWGQFATWLLNCRQKSAWGINHWIEITICRSKKTFTSLR